MKVGIWFCIHPSAIDVVKHVCLKACCVRFKAYHSGLKYLDVVVLESVLMKHAGQCALKLRDALVRVIYLRKCCLLGGRLIKRVVEVPGGRQIVPG